MAYDRLLNREEKPDTSQIRVWIGSEVLSVWDGIKAYLEEHFPSFVPEWVFYNALQGWGLRYRKQAQQLCMLFPEKGAFSALVMLTPEEDVRVMEIIDYFNSRIRGILNRPSSLPQGRWLWVRLEDLTDLVGLTLLLENKNIAD
jgi:hypothetical protein